MQREIKKKWNIWHILGMHDYTNCVEYGDYGLGGETKIEYNFPWALFGTKYTKYQCTDCGRTFWMPKGDFEMNRTREQFIKSLNK